jgi:hypothetical protein
MSADDGLSMWVVYAHPLDYPDSFVARRWTVGRGAGAPTDEVIVAETLPKIRLALMRRGLTPIARNAEDERQIVETWL